MSGRHRLDRRHPERFSVYDIARRAHLSITRPVPFWRRTVVALVMVFILAFETRTDLVAR